MFRAIADRICAVFGRAQRGAAVVRVGVSYRSDPEQVRAILERAASECEFLLKVPAPMVTFDNFGSSALEFAVRAHAANAVVPHVAESELRLRILKAFRAAGVEMPYPQHDIHLRDLDAVRTILTRIAEERSAKAAGSAESKGRPGPSLAGSPRRDTG